MVWLRKLTSGGHIEVEVPLSTAIEEILNHLTKGGIAVNQAGENIGIEDVRKIKDSVKLLLVPPLRGG